MEFESEELATGYDEVNYDVPVQQFLSLEVSQISVKAKEGVQKVLDTTIQKRWDRIRDFPLEFMGSPEFDEEDAATNIIEPQLNIPKKIASSHPLSDDLLKLCEDDVLSDVEERDLFRWYNFCKSRAAKLRERTSPKTLDTVMLTQIEEYLTQIIEARNRIARSNMRLVVSVAKRHLHPKEDLFEKVSDGYTTMLYSLEKFDFTRNKKFSSFATWAIEKQYISRYRMRRNEERRNLKYAINKPEYDDGDPQLQFDREEGIAQAASLLSALNDRERIIIESRFGFHARKPMALKAVGAELGISKERVRQIEARALNKLREALGLIEIKSAVA